MRIKIDECELTAIIESYLRDKGIDLDCYNEMYFKKIPKKGHIFNHYKIDNCFEIEIYIED